MWGPLKVSGQNKTVSCIMGDCLIYTGNNKKYRDNLPTTVGTLARKI